jgi:hypothetical protein
LLPEDLGRSIVQLSYLSARHLYFHYAQGVSSRALADMSDSLVRVSRRDDKKHPSRHICISSIVSPAFVLDCLAGIFDVE